DRQYTMFFLKMNDNKFTGILNKKKQIKMNSLPVVVEEEANPGANEHSIGLLYKHYTHHFILFRKPYGGSKIPIFLLRKMDPNNIIYYFITKV
ncbi:hypothetical protein ACJX0J_020298, partial [Zea mays]